MARHLREQGGGNPGDHGPVPELANRSASPRAGEDFPDAPDTDEPSGPGGDLSDEQLQDFAARLGLGDDDPGDDDAGDRPADDGVAEAGRSKPSARPRRRRADRPADRRPGDPRPGDAVDDPGDAGQDAVTAGAGGPVRRVTHVVVRGIRRPTGRMLIVVSRLVETSGQLARSAGERIAGR